MNAADLQAKVEAMVCPYGRDAAPFQAGTAASHPLTSDGVKAWFWGADGKLVFQRVPVQTMEHAEAVAKSLTEKGHTITRILLGRIERASLAEVISDKRMMNRESGQGEGR